MGALVVVAVAVVPDELAVGSSCCLPMVAVAVVAVVDVPFFLMCFACVGW